MKPGDLVRVSGQTAPMYPDDLDLTRAGLNTHIGYIPEGTVCVFLGSQVAHGSRTITFHRLLSPTHGPVWVRSAWVVEVEHETG